MAEDHEQQTAVPRFVAAPFASLDELFDFTLGKAFSIVIHFVQFSGQ